MAAPRGRVDDGADAMAAVTLALVGAIGETRRQADVLSGQIDERLARHPDGSIFTSLPRSGSLRAAALLAEIGDCRERFPTVEALACLAGAAPSTRQSGQHRVVTFRYACPPDAVGSKFRLSAGDAALEFEITEPWVSAVYPASEQVSKRMGGYLSREWNDVEAGIIELKTGEFPLQLRALAMPGEAMPDFKAVVFEKP